MIKADFKDRKLVVDILVEAFEPLDDDNSINFVVKQDDRRLERMRILMGYLFDKAMDSGEVFLSDNRASCLLINYAHKEQFTLGGLLSMLRLAFKCIGVERVAKVLKRQRMVKRNYPKTDHIRPMIFAIKNEFKGGATAPRLITQVFEEFKKNFRSNPCNFLMQFVFLLALYHFRYKCAQRKIGMFCLYANEK